MHHGIGSTNLLLLLGAAIVLGCNPTEAPITEAPAAVTAAPATRAPAPAAAAVDKGPVSQVEDPTFTLRLAEAGPYKAGELGRFVVHLEPRGEYHVNEDYPIEITVTGDADTAFPKAKLERADAAEFGPEHAKFEVPFTAKNAGARSVTCNVKFAVCTEENCVPDERDLTLSLAVN